MVQNSPSQEVVSSQESQSRSRRVNLRSVNVDQQLHHSFAEKYGFVDNNGNSDVAAALAQLDNTFFKSEVEKGRKISNYHRTQVITVSAETELNPFNAEIYGIFTPFGDLKVMATMDGWLKIATSEPITKREFRYSESSVQTEINGHQYEVPAWIECYIEHKEKGSSQAREYFQEVFDNGQNHLPSWSRPARMLSHVTFIQALRRLLRISSLADSDIISDITKEYEMLVTQAKYQASLEDAENKSAQSSNSIEASTPKVSPVSHGKPRGLNIKLDDVEVVDIEDAGNKDNIGTDSIAPDSALPMGEVDSVIEHQVDQPELDVDDTDLSKEETNITPDTQGVISEKVSSEQSVEKEQQPGLVVQPEQPDSLANRTVEIKLINEMTLPRNVLSMFKPMFQQVLNGDKPLNTLIACSKVITDENAKLWFEQQLAELKEKL